ncbi:hypothetical protein [Planosporangium thailandense]|uniref:hypothetical protein n=1 Tax=Planosporangium thailandense TaxID=765197 RepID=UPI001F0F1EAB|nr:hypothetical protein [Planosporangium thailandense]
MIRELTGGRGQDPVVDAVDMEAGVDRLAALHLAIDAVRRDGTISLAGVYSGTANPRR